MQFSKSKKGGWGGSLGSASLISTWRDRSIGRTAMLVTLRAPNWKTVQEKVIYSTVSIAGCSEINGLGYALEGAPNIVN